MIPDKVKFWLNVLQLLPPRDVNSSPSKKGCEGCSYIYSELNLLTKNPYMQLLTFHDTKHGLDPFIYTYFTCSLYFQQASEDVSKNLAAIKTVLYGTESQEPQTDQVAQLAHEMYDNNMLLLLVQNLGKIDFEV